MKKLGVLIVLLSFSQFSVAQTDSVCNGVLELSGRDLASQQMQLSKAESVYDAMCESNSLKSGIDINIPVAAFVETLPTDLVGTVSGKHEKASNLCKQFASWKALNFASSQATSTVVREAISAWSRCQDFSRNATINIQPGKESLLIAVSRGKEDALFTGVKLSNKSMACTIQKKADNGKLTDVDASDSSQFPLKLAATDTNISCMRTPVKSAAGDNVYEAVEMTILTNQGSLLLPVARDTKYGLTYAAQLDSAMNDLKSQVTALETANKTLAAQLNKVGKATAAEINQPTIMGDGSHQQYGETRDCPAGYYMSGLSHTGWHPMTVYGHTLQYIIPAAIQTLTLRCHPIFTATAQ